MKYLWDENTQLKLSLNLVRRFQAFQKPFAPANQTDCRGSMNP
jgi:hypothetical protein